MGFLPGLLPFACCLLESVARAPVDIPDVCTREGSGGRGTEGEVAPRELNVLAVIKGHERYVFVYDDASRQLLIDSFRDQAADPRLSFNWLDAAVLTDRAREQARQSWEASPPSRTRI